jgi:hypothetical protein
MGSKRARVFECPVVHESVQISLRDKRSLSLQSEKEYFVQCDQADCQYVAENKSPCPLNLSMFSDEIEEREEKNRLRRENRSL